MLYNTDRSQMRQIYFDAWSKFQQSQPLSDLEKQVVAVIMDHPEYHEMFNHLEQHQHKDHIGESNPYLHLGFHLALRDQINMDAPVGIKPLFERLSRRYNDILEVEHLMLECLARALWETTQHPQGKFDSEQYMENLRKL